MRSPVLAQCEPAPDTAITAEPWPKAPTPTVLWAVIAVAAGCLGGEIGVWLFGAPFYFGFFLGLVQGVELVAPPHKARQPAGGSGLQAPPDRARTHQLEDLHRGGQPFDRYRPQRRHLD